MNRSGIYSLVQWFPMFLIRFRLLELNVTINIKSFIVTVDFMEGGKKRTIKNTQTYHKFVTTVSQ